MVDCFNGQLPDGMKMKKDKDKHKGPSASGHFLLCLDNAEALIEHDMEGFDRLLSVLYDRCENLSIIVTSRRGIFKKGEELKQLQADYRIQVLERL